ncbi:hypothetical protein AQ490_05165 [Wenjunlia vitaminophila]|uniref:RNA polymerase sigma factor 70 region 4 type 2 domain-containing protein n=1 Tax=Wenjunlia vitaminophila TaxID=76728 RepID=A0A0T6LNY4_WENVI|nr:hypothetical protein [Wenjunlia vitaminophila]KRV47766.1 hypothetical protein AQ490_05165 [Wenjunlia vitaminophila]
METTIDSRAVMSERGEVLRALTVWDATDRDVVRRLHILRSSPAQAAAALGIPVEEVHRRASRAVAQLCARYREYV